MCIRDSMVLLEFVVHPWVRMCCRNIVEKRRRICGEFMDDLWECCSLTFRDVFIRRTGVSNRWSGELCPQWYLFSFSWSDVHILRFLMSIVETFMWSVLYWWKAIPMKIPCHSQRRVFELDVMWESSRSSTECGPGLRIKKLINPESCICSGYGWHWHTLQRALCKTLSTSSEDVSWRMKLPKLEFKLSSDRVESPSRQLERRGGGVTNVREEPLKQVLIFYRCSGRASSSSLFQVLISRMNSTSLIARHELVEIWTM